MSTEQNSSPSPSRRKRLIVFLLLLLAASALTYFTVKPAREIVSRTHQHAAKDEYYCPMHSSFRSDKPGNCPICGMKLVKLEKNAAQSTEQKGATPSMPGMAAMPEQPSAPGSGSGNTIFVSPQKQQLIGMRTVEATNQPLIKEIRTVGKIGFDETKVTHIHTKVSGYIEEVYADYIGKPVKRGEPLFTIYSPDLVSTQQEFLLALKSRNILQTSALPEVSRGGENLLAAARERLRLWDVTPEEIERLERQGAVKQAIAVNSPVSGVVMNRTAYHHGTYVDPTMELFTIVDLSRVWVLGEIYESDLPFVRVGQLADVSLPNIQSPKMLRAKISFISPFLDPKTRSTQLRIEFDNADFTLKPDMYADVVLHANLGSSLVVPQDALLSTGTEQYVFLDLGQGYVEPRRVEIGPATAESVSILQGLKPGDRVVTAANFIIDAESRLKGALLNMGPPGAPPAQAPAATAQQNLSLSLIEPKRAKVGPNPVRVSLKDQSAQPLDGATVELSISMPQMGSMPPMSAKAELQGVGKGEYAGTITVPMAWTWQTTVTARKGAQVLGSLQTTLTAR